MGFQKIQFKYQPPVTIQTDSVVNTSPAVSFSSNDFYASPIPVSEQSSTNSEAFRLSKRAEVLSETAKYLEQLVLARVGAAGVSIDLAADPDLTQALGRIYQTGTPPTGMTASMYSHLLDTELGIVRAEIALNRRSSVASGALTPNPIVSPIQKMDILRATRMFDKTVTENGDFRSNLTSFLRILKGDRVIFDHLRQSLLEYPAVAANKNTLAALSAARQPNGNIGVSVSTSPQQPNGGGNAIGYVSSILEKVQTGSTVETKVDIHPDTAANLDERMNAWEKLYAEIHETTVSVDAVYFDLLSISQKYLYRTVAELEAILAAISVLRVTVHKPKLSDLKCALTSFIFPRLIAEVSRMNMLMDRIVQKTVSPITNMLNSFERLFSEAQHVSKDIAFLVNGGLKNAVHDSISGKKTEPLPSSKQQKLDAIPAGIRSLVGTLSWAMQKSKKKRDFLEQSMFRAIDRKLNDSGDLNSFLQSMKSLEALVDITRSFLRFSGNGNNLFSFGTQAASSTLSSFGQVVSQLKSGGDTSFRLLGEKLVPISKELPLPSLAVKKVLVSGGASLLDGSDLIGSINV